MLVHSPLIWLSICLQQHSYSDFGGKLTKVIDVMCKDINSSVSLPRTTTFVLIYYLFQLQRYEQSFSKIAQMLSPMYVWVLTQLADDTTIFLKRAGQISSKVNKIDNFSNLHDYNYIFKKSVNLNFNMWAFNNWLNLKMNWNILDWPLQNIVKPENT